jgi:membrane protease YdiL (CAAX protease family)
LQRSVAMTLPPSIRIPVRELIAIILVLVFVYFARAWLQLELRGLGLGVAYSKDISYLIVTPVLVLMLLPILWHHRDFLRQLLDRTQLTVPLVLSAIALGILMRLVYWGQLIARVSFGIARDSDPDAAVGPVFSFSCPPPQVIGTGFLVMALLVPVIEEIVNRGVIQSTLVHRGRTAAILTSAIVFTLLHSPSGYAFVFVMGIVLGLQFWNTRTLWASIITHATFNGLAQLDWRCLRGTWNPTVEQIPALLPGIVALGILVAASACAIWLLTRKTAGA